MAKETGLGGNFYIAGVDVSGDVGSIGALGGGPAALELTGIDKSGYERVAGDLDGRMSWSSWFNKTRAHLTLRALPRTDVIMTYFHHAGTIGNVAAGMVGKQPNYDGQRGNDGSFTFAVDAVANGYGLEWGNALTAGKRSDTTATNGASLDFAASSAFGLRAFLHVFTFTGTSVTVKIQSSSDDAVGDPYSDVTGGGFTAVTAAPASQRIATSPTASIERYLRVVTTGTFTQATFAVVVCKDVIATPLQ